LFPLSDNDRRACVHTKDLDDVISRKVIRAAEHGKWYFSGHGPAL
jgi:hypothetical protein